MSNEIKFEWTTGKTCKVLVQSPAGQFWTGTGNNFETYNAANITGYVVAVTEVGTTGFYVGSFPTAITTPAVYQLTAIELAGATIAASDLPRKVRTGSINWSGTAEVVALTGDAYAVVSQLAINGGGVTIFSNLDKTGYGLQNDAIDEDKISDDAVLKIQAGLGDATLAKQNQILAKVTVPRLTVVSPVVQDKSLTIYRGFDYDEDEVSTIGFTIKDYAGPTIVGASVVLKVALVSNPAVAVLSLDGEMEMAGADLLITFEASASETSQLSASSLSDVWDYVYQVSITYADNKTPPPVAAGAATVKEKIG